MKKNQRIYSKGFTLIETLFAVLIFSAALISLLTIAGKGIAATSQAKNETTAYYLAQEGLEVVRSIRDVNFSNNNTIDWTKGIADGAIDCATEGCYVVYQSPLAPILSLGSSASANKSYQINEINGIYNDYTAGTPTSFYRKIRVVPVSNSNSIIDEYQVYATVWWDSKGVTRNVELQTILKKWR